MKKFMGLAAVVAAFALASCGGSNSTENTDSTVTDSVKVEAPADSVSTTDSVAQDTTANAEQAPAQEGQATEAPAQN